MENELGEIGRRELLRYMADGPWKLWIGESVGVAELANEWCKDAEQAIRQRARDELAEMSLSADTLLFWRWVQKFHGPLHTYLGRSVSANATHAVCLEIEGAGLLRRTIDEPGHCCFVLANPQKPA